MNPSLFSPSCSWNKANVRSTKLHLSRISSRSNSYFWRNQLLRVQIFKSNVGKLWVQLLHALVERFIWRNGHTCYPLFLQWNMFVPSLALPGLLHIYSFIFEPCLDRKPKDTMDRYLQSTPITAPWNSTTSPSKISTAEENLLCNCRALWARNSMMDTSNTALTGEVRQTPCGGLQHALSSQPRCFSGFSKVQTCRVYTFMLTG